jgi:hypothetical protein
MMAKSDCGVFSGSDFHEKPIDGTSTCASIWHVAREELGEAKDELVGQSSNNRDLPFATIRREGGLLEIQAKLNHWALCGSRSLMEPSNDFAGS